MKNNMQPNPDWALGTGKNCFVACCRKTWKMPTNTKTSKQTTKHIPSHFCSSAFQFRSSFTWSWFRCPIRNAEIHQGRRGHRWFPEPGRAVLVEAWKRRFTHLVMEQIRVVAQLYHYQISASLDPPNDPHLKFVHEQFAASNTVKSPSWKTTFRTLRVYAPSTLHFRRKSVHWNSKHVNGTNGKHTEPFNLEMYLGLLKSNVVFSELKASTCIFPMAVASIPDV